jgi:hypothetical protein
MLNFLRRLLGPDPAARERNAALTEAARLALLLADARIEIDRLHAWYGWELARLRAEAVASRDFTLKACERLLLCHDILAKLAERKERRT